MKEIICQSCSMTISNHKEFGTNKDGSTNQDYCTYCYKDGEFTKDVSLEEYIEMNIPFHKEAGMSEDQMREYCKTVFPTLKRWACTCTNECASGYNPVCTCTNPKCNCSKL